EFPKDVVMNVSVSRLDRAALTINQPDSAETNGKCGWHSFRMHVPGIFFFLNVGKQISQEMRKICFYKGTNHQLIVSDRLSDRLFCGMAAQFHESRKTHAYLRSTAKRMT